MISEYLQKQIKFQWLKYNKFICKIPAIEKVEILAEDNTWAYFKNDDIYKQRYVLYVNPHLEETYDEFIEQILFHEFTHISDSLKFKNVDKKTFTELMNIYSEIHASQVQMNRMLLTQNTKSYSLDQQIICEKKVTLKSYMEHSLYNVEKEFTVSRDKITADNLRYSTKELFYFIGKLSSLKKNGIKFDYDYSNVDERFRNLFYEITNFVLRDNIDAKELLLYNKQLTSLIKDVVRDNNEKYVLSKIGKILKPSDIKCSKCGSINIETEERKFFIFLALKLHTMFAKNVIINGRLKNNIGEHR